MTATSALPPSVAALNRLLEERRAPDGSLRAALGISYLVHVAGVLALAYGFRTGILELGSPDQPIHAASGIIPVTPIYNPDPGPRPRAAAPLPAPVEKAPEPPAPVPKPEPVAEDPADEVIPERTIPERTRARRTPVPAKATPAAAPRAAVNPRAAATPVPGEHAEMLSIPSAQGGPGSPLGTLSGHPDGGLLSIARMNQWYVGRVRDLIYGNWQNPFVTSARPPNGLEVTVSFRILRTGQVDRAEVSKSSGNAAWDRSGIRAVEGVTLPPLPRDFTGSSVAVDFSFHYDPSR